MLKIPQIIAYKCLQILLVDDFKNSSLQINLSKVNPFIFYLISIRIYYKVKRNFKI